MARLDHGMEPGSKFCGLECLFQRDFQALKGKMVLYEVDVELWEQAERVGQLQV